MDDTDRAKLSAFTASFIADRERVRKAAEAHEHHTGTPLEGNLDALHEQALRAQVARTGNRRTRRHLARAERRADRHR